MADYKYDLVVIGSGPGGYVAAIRATQLGLSVAVIEKEKPGGVCLNVGCIPSKALIHQAEIFGYQKDLEELGIAVDASKFDYKNVYKKSRQAADRLSKGVQGLLKKNKVEYIEATASLKTQHEVALDNGEVITAKNILIATGSRPREIPGFEFDEKQVLSSTGALYLEKLPKSIIILGGGYIGMEFAHVMSSFGVAVTVVEMLDRVIPLSDPEVVSVLEKDFKRRPVEIMTGTMAKKLTKSKSGIKLEVGTAEGDKTLEADMLLVSVGRAPNTENIGLDKVGIKTEKGFIKVRDYYQTDVSGIYAIGDVVATPQLAHVASKEGEIAVEHMAGHHPEMRVDPDLVPAAIYTEPQIASFGPTEDEAKERGLAFEKAVFPYRGAGKSVAIGHPEGMVKLLYNKESGELIAAHIVGHNATELIHELLLGKRSELLPEDIATTIHAHPTLSEAVMEAARAAEGWAIHA
ncbi:MAG: dihydrolipoyl dehydrogenase [Spirochaetales bacterium]